MARAFADIGDAASKLTGSFCSYQNEPVLVLGVLGDMVSFKYLSTGKSGSVSYLSDDFSYETMELGYATDGHVAVYLSRIPGRYSYEGLQWNSIHRIGGTGTSLTNRCLADCIKANHPTFKKALSYLKEGCHSVPFSRHLAVQIVDNDYATLMYKGSAIGSIEMNGPVIYPLAKAINSKLFDRIIKQAGLTYVNA
jgi:hypothetical protein